MAADTKPKYTVQECEKLLCVPGSVFELEERTLWGHTQKVWKHQVPTFRALITSRMPVHGARAFLSSPIADPEPFDAREALSHGAAYARAVRFAALLRGAGVGAGDRVALGGTNCTGWVVAFLGAHLAGAVPVLLNNGLHADATLHCLRLARPALVVLDDAMAEQVARVAPQLRAAGVHAPVWCWTALAHLSPRARTLVRALADMEPAPADVAAVETHTPDVGPESDAIVYFTSGTTSMPKGVLVTQRQALHVLLSTAYVPARMALRLGATPAEATALATAPKEAGTCALLSIPLFHVQGNLNWLVCAVAEGTKLAFLRRWSVPDAIKVMVAENVGKIGGVPAIATSVLQSPLLPDTFQLASTTFGGASPPTRLPADIMRRFPACVPATGWGMTETNSTHTSFAGQEYVRKPKACGQPVPVCTVKIVDPETREELPPGTPGLLLAYGSNIMKCYVDNPKATAETLVDGWLDTGDIASLDADGDLFISDRAKDIIIRGGENIPSAEVERALAQDDRVAEACAVPVPDDVLGERVGAAVSLAPGAHATAESIAEAVFPRLRYPARPAVVLVSEGPLPWNASQKILKSEVKKMVVDKWERAGRKPLVDPSRARL